MRCQKDAEREHDLAARDVSADQGHSLDERERQPFHEMYRDLGFDARFRHTYFGQANSPVGGRRLAPAHRRAK
ncbi:hypothetical protein [Kitasatospora sp. NBC_00458]|uniref:hypothetical protein n=1 Tax=Kitasatospora sp. NBC_00458 TaxID=2903568 RepID=UPI002E171072